MPAVIDDPALAMYVAAGVALVVVLGFFLYLWSLDRAVAELRRRIDERPTPAAQIQPPLRPHRRVEQGQPDGSVSN